MPLLRILKLALTGLRMNKGRTVLTTVGIVIGIATVIIVVSVGESAKYAIQKQLLSFGGNSIIAEISVPNTSHANSSSSMVSGVQITTMKESDMKAVEELPNVDKGYAMVMTKEKLSYLNKTKRSAIWGSSYTYPEIDDAPLEKGRFFTMNEEKGMEKVIVLGNKVAEDLFDGVDPIGKTIKVKQMSFRVIGVMKKRGMSFFMNMDEIVFIPLKTTQKLLLGINYITHFTAKAKDKKLIFQTAEDMRFILRKRHHIDFNDPNKDDFQVTTMDDALEMTTTIIGGVALLLTAIAIISLIVGGVGIMNIMYVSVSERTREIGLRKAVGADKNSILTQFLLEALSVTFVGGILGVMLGLIVTFLASFGARKFGLDWQFIISIKSIFMAVIASTAIGLIFGIYPARKASNLDPIIALRRE